MVGPSAGEALGCLEEAHDPDLERGDQPEDEPEGAHRQEVRSGVGQAHRESLQWSRE
jgi:hypothetical protein